jgi:hypothetical protein
MNEKPPVPAGRSESPASPAKTNVPDRPTPRPQDIKDLGPIEAEPLSDVTKLNIRREHQRQVQMTETVTNAHRTPSPGDVAAKVVLPPYRGATPVAAKASDVDKKS